MSVINQMLKELDKRQNGNTMSSAAPSNIKEPRSSKKLVILVLIINVLAIIAFVFYLQPMYIQATDNNSEINTHIKQASTTQDLKKDEDSKDPQILTKSTSPQRHEQVPPDNKPKYNQIVRNNKIEKESVAEINKHQDNVNKVNISSEVKDLQAKFQAQQAQLAQVQAALKRKKAAENHNNEEITQLNTKKEKTNNIKEVIKKEPKLIISRRNLSVEELVKKKIMQAKIALENNHIIDAEALFTDILLLKPEDKNSRKQLAALWYGKKQYHDALNLLAKGLLISPQDEDMRMMSARIYYEQGDLQKAFDLLSHVKKSEKVDIIALFATISAELNDHKQAMQAYQRILKQQPERGRWWLGLAVALDSQGLFDQATNAYKQAQTKGDLSPDVMTFIQQRLSELGE